MNSIFQFIGTFASIFSIPLAIILYFKTSDARQNKIRLEIIRSLSYRIGEGNILSKVEVSAVFNSKLREHNIRKPIFSEVSILEDIIADAVSNPFLTSEQKTSIITSVSDILQSYGVIKEPKENVNSTNNTAPSAFPNVSNRKRNIGQEAFAIIAAVFSGIVTLAIGVAGEFFTKYFQSTSISVELVFSVAITVLASLMTVLLDVVIKKIKKRRRK